MAAWGTFENKRESLDSFEVPINFSGILYMLMDKGVLFPLGTFYVGFERLLTFLLLVNVLKS